MDADSIPVDPLKPAKKNQLKSLFHLFPLPDIIYFDGMFPDCHGDRSRDCSLGKLVTQRGHGGGWRDRSRPLSAGRDSAASDPRRIMGCLKPTPAKASPPPTHHHPWKHDSWSCTKVLACLLKLIPIKKKKKPEQYCCCQGYL